MKNRQDGEPVADDDTLTLAAAIENTPDIQNFARIPHFGIWNPNIKEAAELVVVDMWFSGEIEGVNEPEDFDGNARDPWLKAALADTITTIEERLSSAIDSGRPQASAIQRDLDDRLIPEKTHISYDQLVEWMDERNLYPGEHMADWVDTEATISELICDEVAFLRDADMSSDREIVRISQRRSAAKYGLQDEAQDLVEAQTLLRATTAENARLKKRLALFLSEQPAKVDRPVKTRQRRTLLTIIAALCDHAGIDYKKLGAAKRIMDATERIGAPVDDGTIKKLLDEIPDALETRMK